MTLIKKINIIKCYNTEIPKPFSCSFTYNRTAHISSSCTRFKEEEKDLKSKNFGKKPIQSDFFKDIEKNCAEFKEKLVLSSQKILNSLKKSTEPFKKIEWSKLSKEPAAFIKSAALSINQVTGYNEIEKLKTEIDIKALEFQKAKENLRISKEKYQSCIEARAKGQREINNLLQRKHAWSDEDLNQFTQLYRLEHQHDNLEQSSKEDTKRLEDLVEIKYDQLVAAIRTRYQEEQLWSDKIRGASTYWTLALIVINMVMFLSVHTIFEPRKRHKLIEKVQENLLISLAQEKENLESSINLLNDKFEFQKSLLSDLALKLDNFTERKSKSQPDSNTEYSSEAIQDKQLSLLFNNLLNSIPETKKTDTPQASSCFELKQQSMYYEYLNDRTIISIGSAIVGATISALLTLAFSR